MGHASKALALMLSATLAGGGLPVCASAQVLSTQDAEGIIQSNLEVRHQLVVLVRFKGDATGDNGDGYNAPYLNGTSTLYDTEWQYFLDTLNREKKQYWQPSLHAYVEEVSGGVHQVISDAPQTNADGTVNYLTMPHERSYYTSQDLLMKDAAVAFNAAYPDYQGQQLNSAGYYDNVLLIPEVGNDAPENAYDPLWSRALTYTYGTATIGDGKVGSYILVNSANAGYTATICHEYLHTLGQQGLRDLYRIDQQNSYVNDSSSNSPVGLWDIMAQSVTSWPLAVTRENVGWTTISEAQGSGSYTLTTSYSSAGEQALKIKTSQSSSEYFVVEYRHSNKGSYDYSLLDRKIGQSGLVVYRVNEEWKDAGNKGEGDYLYVFRPGETAFNAGNGNLANAALSLGGTSSLGLSDRSASTPDGAIYYADGSNSGIVLQVTAETENSVTFQLTIPEISSDDWAEALDESGSTPLGNMSATAVETATDGSSTFVLVENYEDGANSSSVLRFDGESWSSLGVVSRNVYAGTGQIACANDVLYVAGMTASGLEAYAWNGSAWSRLDVSAVPSSVNQFRLSASDGTLFLSGSFGDYSFTSDAQWAQAFSLSGRAFATLGDTSVKGKSIAGTAAFSRDGVTYLVAGDSVRGTTRVLKLQSGAWVQLFADDSYGADEATVAFARGSAWILANNSQKEYQRLYELNNQGSIAAETLSFLGQCGCGVSITSSGAKLLTCATSRTSSRSSTVVYERDVEGSTDWTRLGNAVTTSTNDGSAAVACGGRILVATCYNAPHLRWLAYEAAVAPSDPVTPQPTTPVAPEPAAGQGAFAQGMTQVAMEAAIAKGGEEGPAGTSFSALRAKVSKTAKKSIKIKWSKVPKAVKYLVYAAPCGKSYKLVKSTGGMSFTQGKLKRGSYHKYLVVALDGRGTVLTVSKALHATTDGGKHGNPKKVVTAAKKGRVTLSVGKSFKLKAKAVLPAGKRGKTHRKMRYESSNEKVAKVSGRGKVKAVGKGWCYVYAYCQNGRYARVKVTVR